LQPREKGDAEKIAVGALAFISEMEKKNGRLSQLDQMHRQILQTFLAQPPGGLATQSHSAKP
jgi:hypothetical protein